MIDLDMSLSASFRLWEFCKSTTAVRMGKTIEPDETIVDNLQRLCRDILQPLRNEVHSTIRITSGYRPTWLNTAIGGSSTSAHVFGCAADIEVDGMKNEAVCLLVQKMGLPVDQCILEFPPNGWVHLGIARVGPYAFRKQFLTARKVVGHTTYELGIHP